MTMMPPGWPSEETNKSIRQSKKTNPVAWRVFAVLFVAMLIFSAIMYVVDGGTPLDKVGRDQQLQQETQFAPDPLDTQTSVACAINGCPASPSP